jgi:flagellin-like hook-associated protein FlgL
MLSLLTNFNAALGISAMRKHNQELATSFERLSTGRRINRASDDPAGAVAEDNLNSQIKSIEKKMDSYKFEEKRLGAVEGAQGVLQDLILELSGLVPESANTGGLSAAERKANQQEVDSVLDTIDHLATTTRFDGDLIIAGSTAAKLGLAELRTGGKQNLVDGDLEKAQDTVKSAVESMGTQRAGAGLREKQIQSDMRVLGTQYEALSATRSQIVDTDYAAETAEYVRASMLRDVAQFVTSISLKQNTDLVMKLLQPLQRAA